jgi:aminoglycoside phosphotransferase family enzyme
MVTTFSGPSTKADVDKDEKQVEEEYISKVKASENSLEEEHVYEIEAIVDSASAFVCIAHRQEDTEQRLVFKILRECKDKRYQYGSAEERLECQKKAWRKNNSITPGIYQGIARILQPTLREIEEQKHAGKLQSITIGSIMHDDEQIEHISEQDGEYALVMSYLSEKQRFDLLLRENPSEKQKELYMDALALRIEKMHKIFRFPPKEVDEHGYVWGSYEQLLKKLEHNLIHFDLIERYNLTLYEECSKLIQDLKVNLRHFIEQQQLQDAFKERLQHGYIKQCHGDLKTNNIWIETIKQDDNFLHYVRILDAVDFNESYRNIDVLADLAMLVVDIEVTGNEVLGALLKEKYLLLTEQTGDAARFVLAYYLLEKSIVCAIVCIVYDHCELDKGPRFLKLANKYAEELSKLLNSQPSENLIQHAV